MSKDIEKYVCTKCGGTRIFTYYPNGNIKSNRLRAEKGCKHHWVETK